MLGCYHYGYNHHAKYYYLTQLMSCFLEKIGGLVIHCLTPDWLGA